MGPYGSAPAPPPAPPPALHPCPRCGLTDRIRGVPAVYHAGRSRVTSRHPQGDVGHRTREVVSDLSRALAPAPIRDRPPGLTMLVLGAVTTAIAVFAFIAGNLARTFDDDEPGFATLQDQGHQAFEVPAAIPVIALFVAAVFFVTGGVLNASATRELAGRPRAEHLWATAWYCDRCGTVHFPPGRGLPAGALSLREFRRVVWHAGGYGHLVRGD